MKLILNFEFKKQYFHISRMSGVNNQRNCQSLKETLPIYKYLAVQLNEVNCEI